MPAEEFKPKAGWEKAFAKKFGETALPASKKRPHAYRGSGSLALDIALGGGWVKPSVVQLCGKEGGGKTLLFDLAAIEAQQVEKKKSIMFDFEGTYSVDRFIDLGGNPDMLTLIQHENCTPMLLQDIAFDMAKVLLLNSDEYACFGFDSTAAMVPRETYEKVEAESEQGRPMLVAKTLSEWLPIFVGLSLRNPTHPTLFFVSQGRDNIGAASFRGPAPDKQTGGRALPFHATTRVLVSKGDVYRADSDDTNVKDIEVGHVTKVKVLKQKGNAFQSRVAQFDLYTAGPVLGIDRVEELVTAGLYAKTILQEGSWFTVFDVRAQGRQKLKETLEQNAALFARLRIETRTKLIEMIGTDAENEA